MIGKGHCVHATAVGYQMAYENFLEIHKPQVPFLGSTPGITPKG